MGKNCMEGKPYSETETGKLGKKGQHAARKKRIMDSVRKAPDHVLDKERERRQKEREC